MRIRAARRCEPLGGTARSPIDAARIAGLSVVWAAALGTMGCDPYDFDMDPRVPASPSNAILLPAGVPGYLPTTYRAALECPLPRLPNASGEVAPVLPQLEEDADPTGTLASYQPGGPTDPGGNPFFQALGTNGRACVTCHAPADAMSLSVDDIRRRFWRTGGTDPLFAPVDGANCPNAVGPGRTSAAPLGGRIGEGTTYAEAAHSLLLSRGLFRIFLPVPADADFTIRVVRDPYGCNTNPTYAEKTDPRTGARARVISVYRRPRPTTNLKFVTATRQAGDRVIGEGPQADRAESNIMWDGREPELESQAIDATLTHAQAVAPPSGEQIAQILAFARGIYSAQIVSKRAHSLTDLGALGGPDFLATVTPPSEQGGRAFALFDSWKSLSLEADRRSERESVYRGQQIFDTRKFTISGVAGLNDLPGAKDPLRDGTCSTCHNQSAAGTDALAGAQLDVGVGGDSPELGGPPPSGELPIFRVACKDGGEVGFHGRAVTTNDPGKALITGKCADVGRFTVAPLRGLAARAPYFSDGSAKTLSDVVRFYERRFSIGLSSQDKEDLANFLSAL
jgi:cytochrome c peroxidase